MAKRSLTKEAKEAINTLFERGVTDVQAALSALTEAGFKVDAQQLGGMLTLWKRSKAGAAGFGPSQPSPKPHVQAQVHAAAARVLDQPASAQVPKSVPKGDGFGWDDPPRSPGAGSGLGDDEQVELHIFRIGPTNDGFLGVETPPFDLEQLGRKYGSGMYEITLYMNGTQIKKVKKQVSQVFGAPKYPRATPGAPDPRLVMERPNFEHRPPLREESPVKETVEIIKAVRDLDKGDEKPGAIPEAESWLDRERKRLDIERADREARAAADKAAADERHTREMERMKEEYAHREREAKAQRDHIEKLELARNKELQDAIAATNASIAGLQANMEAEIQKNQAALDAKLTLEREHQKEMAALREKELERERERIAVDRARVEADAKLQREWQEKMYDLQVKALPGKGDTVVAELVASTLKDCLVRVDEKAGKVIELAQLKQLAAVLGPDQAQQLFRSFVMNGGGEIAKFLAGGPAAAPGARGQEAAKPVQETPAAKPEPEAKGDPMNGIAQQVYATPFFKDLIEIWGGHLRLKRTPYLFANQMAGYMMEDRRVELFYSYMASKPWGEFLPEILEKVPEALRGHFKTPEAEKFFDTVVELIAKRIEADHVARGITSEGAQPAAAASTPEPDASERRAG